MSDYVTGRAAWNEDKQRLFLLDSMEFNASVRRMFKPGAGEEFGITVEPLIAARTSEHNRAYWGYIVRPVHLYSDGGMSLNAVHRLFKAEFLPSERFRLADPTTGAVVLERDMEKHTTRTLSEQDFRDYMEECRTFAAEQCHIDMSDRGLWERFGIGTR